MATRITRKEVLFRWRNIHYLFVAIQKKISYRSFVTCIPAILNLNPHDTSVSSQTPLKRNKISSPSSKPSPNSSLPPPSLLHNSSSSNSLPPLLPLLLLSPLPTLLSPCFSSFTSSFLCRLFFFSLLPILLILALSRT
jgi:hypothetical protein